MLYHKSGHPIQPGNKGEDCPSQEKYFYTKDGEKHYICMDCFYLKCCYPLFDNQLCMLCRDYECPRAGKKL